MATRGTRTNLVDSPASLIGRVEDRAAIATFFDGGVRLVTIVAAGGLGKTRVALRYGAERMADYASHGNGGVWLCDVTDARSAMAICAVVAAALEVTLDRSLGEPQVIAELGVALARKQRVLVVLDNFEHLIGEAAATIGAWMSAAPHAQFLVTSRIALGLPGEQVWPLAALGVPLDGDATPDHLAGVEAVALFVARARLLRPDLPLAPADLAAIAEIVRRLEGIPLAIELAAARVRALSPGQIRDRLERPLDLLVRSGDPGRHGSIRRTIDDSLELLDPITRACFAGAAIFRGGFTLEAAEAVLGDPGGSVLRALETLCEHSLLRIVVDPATGESRFRSYELLQQVAAEALRAQPDLHHQLARRHAGYFARYGRGLADRALASAERGALARLALELENIVEAHARVLAARYPGHGAELQALALALDPLLSTRGMLRLRLRLLDATIGAIGVPEPVVSDDAAMVIARGQVHRELGAFDRARADLELARTLAHRAADACLEALAEARLGELVEIAGDTREARGRFQIGLAVIARAPHAAPMSPIVEAELHARLGHALRREGDLVAAAASIERATVLYRAAHHDEGLAAMAYEAGVIALFRGHHAESRRGFDEALAIARALGARLLEAAACSAIGILTQALGTIDAAIALHAAAVQSFRDLGNRHREGSALYYLAGAYLERGEPAQAIRVLDQAVVAVRGVGAARYEALIAGARAAALAMSGDASAGAAAFAEAERAAGVCRSEPSLSTTLAIHHLHLAPDLDDAQARRALLAHARTLAASAAGDDPTFALRVLVARLAGAARPPRGDAPIVRPGARAVRLPGAREDIDLSRRAPLRRIVDSLVRRRLDAPGEALAFDELVAAGWPGEQIRHAAASNRLHVALTTLRKLGLRGLLVSGEHGYLIDPTVSVHVEPA